MTEQQAVAEQEPQQEQPPQKRGYREMMGRKYRDRVTGFEGVATSITFYLNGCVRFGLEKLDDKGMPTAAMFDQQVLEEVGEGVTPQDPILPTGGPQDHSSVVDTH